MSKSQERVQEGHILIFLSYFYSPLIHIPIFFHLYSLYKIDVEAQVSDFFQDWWAKVTHGAKNDGSFFKMMGPSISN